MLESRKFQPTHAETVCALGSQLHKDTHNALSHHSPYPWLHGTGIYRAFSCSSTLSASKVFLPARCSVAPPLWIQGNGAAPLLQSGQWRSLCRKAERVSLSWLSCARWWMTVVHAQLGLKVPRLEPRSSSHISWSTKPRTLRQEGAAVSKGGVALNIMYDITRASCSSYVSAVVDCI